MSPINSCHQFNDTHLDQLKGFCNNYWGNCDKNEAQWHRPGEKKACFCIILRQDAPNVGQLKKSSWRLLSYVGWGWRILMAGMFGTK